MPAGGCSTASRYTGGFALALAPGCDETIAIDVSEDAIARVRQNAARNGVTIDARVGNVFDELRGLDRLGERFDTIVLDPPAFAKNKAAVTNARAGYKEINLRALKLLNPGGTLVTCSCSYNVNEGMFGEIVYEAALDAHGQRDRRRKADAGTRPPRAARRSRNLLPEMFHPQKTVAAAAAEARRAIERLARPAGDFDASRYFRGRHGLGFYNTGTGPMRALAPDRFTRRSAPGGA